MFKETAPFTRKNDLFSTDIARHIKIQIWERHTYVLYMLFHLLILPIQIPRIYVSSSSLISNSSYRKRDLYLPFKQIFVAISHHRAYIEEICSMYVVPFFCFFYVPSYVLFTRQYTYFVRHERYFFKVVVGNDYPF